MRRVIFLRGACGARDFVRKARGRVKIKKARGRVFLSSRRVMGARARRRIRRVGRVGRARCVKNQTLCNSLGVINS